MKEFFFKLGMPLDYSTHGAQVDDLNAIMHWMMLVLIRITTGM